MDARTEIARVAVAVRAEMARVVVAVRAEMARVAVAVRAEMAMGDAERAAFNLFRDLRALHLLWFG